MKQQFKSLLLCVFASMFFLLSCKKEKAQPKCSPLKATYTTTNEILSPPPYAATKNYRNRAFLSFGGKQICGHLYVELNYIAPF
jgi:hypothetical protein